MLYPVAIELGDKDTAFGATVPDIKGCYSAGDTAEECIRNVKEAIELQLESLCERKLDIPKASSIKDFINNKEFAGHIWAVVEVDITPYLGKSQKVNVTLPESLILKIDKTVAKNATYKTRSGFLAAAALHELDLAH